MSLLALQLRDHIDIIFDRTGREKASYYPRRVISIGTTTRRDATRRDATPFSAVILQTTASEVRFFYVVISSATQGSHRHHFWLNWLRNSSGLRKAFVSIRKHDSTPCVRSPP
jgi:hypothetical protein